MLLSSARSRATKALSLSCCCPRVSIGWLPLPLSPTFSHPLPSCLLSRSFASTSTDDPSKITSTLGSAATSTAMGTGTGTGSGTGTGTGTGFGSGERSATGTRTRTSPVTEIPVGLEIPLTMIVTTPYLPGHRVTKVCGVVIGNTVRTRNALTESFANFKGLFGGELNAFTRLMLEARTEAVARMVVTADLLGANAILQTRFDSNQFGRNAIECVVYGTAVVVEQSHHGQIQHDLPFYETPQKAQKGAFIPEVKPASSPMPE